MPPTIVYKAYQCNHCSTIHRVHTNHYGEIYSRCPNFLCVSRRPMINVTWRHPAHTCLDTPTSCDPMQDIAKHNRSLM